MFENAEIIHSYTRAEAIADGFLVDVTSLAKSLKFIVPVAVTHTVFEDVTRLPEPGSSLRLAGLLESLRSNVHTMAEDSDIVHFEYEGLKLWAKFGPGDAGEPVITIMRTDED